jgi:imidazolonepropionase-like amidohydrolase
MDLLIESATLLDLDTGELHGGSSVRVEGDRIVETARGRTLAANDEILRVDAGDRVLLPGFIDAHVHAAFTTMNLSEMWTRPPSRRAIETKNILEAMLRRGFTTVRDAGGLDKGISESIDAGLINGPRVFRSGRVLSQTGGHGDGPSTGEPLCACHIKTSDFSHVADGVDAVRRAAREELKNGAHQIKVMAGGGVVSPTDPIDMVQYTGEEIRAAVTEASARRTYVLAHAYIPEAIIQAVEAGVRSIEHGNLIDESAARVMAEHDCFLVPTLATYDAIARLGKQFNFPPESLRKLNDVLEDGAKAIEIAVAAGVSIGFGTDLLGEAHDRQSREFELRAAVQSPLDVLRSATITNAELIGKAGELGVVAPEAFADLVLVDGNPLEDVAVLGGQGDRLDLIVRGGEVIQNRLHRV